MVDLLINDIYSKPITGSGLPFFAGSRRQFGGSLFGALSRIISPVFTNVVKPMAKTVFYKAIDVGKNVALDALQGQNVKDSLTKHATNAATSTLQNLFNNNNNTRKRKATATAAAASTSVKQK